MAFLFPLFTFALSFCVVGLIVLALSSILGSVRDDWKLKKPQPEPKRMITAYLDNCVVSGMAVGDLVPAEMTAVRSLKKPIDDDRLQLVTSEEDSA